MIGPVYAGGSGALHGVIVPERRNDERFSVNRISSPDEEADPAGQVDGSRHGAACAGGTGHSRRADGTDRNAAADSGGSAHPTQAAAARASHRARAGRPAGADHNRRTSSEQIAPADPSQGDRSKHRRSARDRILLIGPCPPPECGTSIPFQALLDFLKERSAAEIVVISSTSGSKKGVPLLSRRILGPFLRIARGFLAHAASCNRFVFYGSQRFAATAGSLFTFVAARVLRREASIYIQGGGFDVFYRSRPRLARAMVRFCFRRARAVAVQTRQLQESLAEEFPNLVVLPNWSKMGLEAEADASRTDGEGSPVVRFLYLGQIKKEKGVGVLVRSFAAARDLLLGEGRGSALDIFGPKVDAVLDEVAQLIAASQGTISYHGNVPHGQVASILREHDVLVLPTEWPTEGYPAVVIEAMASGLPVIATRFRALPEIVIDGRTGLLCEPGDPESLALCMIRLARDPALRRRMGREALGMAARFDAEAVLPELCRAFGLPLRG